MYTVKINNFNRKFSLYFLLIYFLNIIKTDCGNCAANEECYTNKNNDLKCHQVEIVPKGLSNKYLRF